MCVCVCVRSLLDPAPAWTQSIAPARESELGGSAVGAHEGKETVNKRAHGSTAAVKYNRTAVCILSCNAETVASNFGEVAERRPGWAE